MTPSPAVAPTAPASGLARAAADSELVAGMLLDWLTVLLVLVGVAAAAMLVARLWRTGRLRQLVVPPLVDGSGAGLDGAVPGLSALARAGLVDHLGRVRQRVRSRVAEGRLGSATLSPLSPLPATVADERLTALLASLQEFGPEQAKGAMGVLASALARPRGQAVAATLQRRPSDGVTGVTLEVTDLGQGEAADPVTFWEPEPVPRGGPDSARGGPGDGRERVLVASLALAAANEPPDRGAAKARYRAVAAQAPAASDPDAAAAWNGYRRLLEPAMRWTAIELTGAELIATLPAWLLAPERRRDTGLVRNFVGTLHLATAQADDFAHHRPTFLDAAERWVARAIEDIGDLPRPHFDRAEIAAARGKYLTGEPAVRALRRAAAAYEDAFARTGALHAPAERRAVEASIRIKRAVVAARLGASGALREACADIDALDRPDGEGRWAAVREPNRVVLYNLACWYALVAARDGVPARYRTRAWECLVLVALHGAGELPDAIWRDDDLAAHRAGLPRLRDAVRERAAALSALQGAERESAVRDLVAGLGLERATEGDGVETTATRGGRG